MQTGPRGGQGGGEGGQARRPCVKGPNDQRDLDQRDLQFPMQRLDLPCQDPHSTWPGRTCFETIVSRCELVSLIKPG